ncbi:MAG: class I SAM-dependent rRNA methyltransferase [Saprospiraceae bacterium]|nr:class I SAM-dependent rRNA methyltransferase [Saprospiraceae bacterium]
MPCIFLKNQRDQSVLRRHPWIFSGAIEAMDPGLGDGDLVSVYNKQKLQIAYGHFYHGSIAVKILNFGPDAYSESIWFDKIQKAYDLRISLIQSGLLDSDAWRWVNGEGDGLPGLIIDRFGSLITIQCHSIGMHRSIALISQAILDVDAANILCIYDKSKESLPAEYAAGLSNGVLFGELKPTRICEHGINYWVDPVHGQKTGFFLDQRDNRALVKKWSRNKRVLNTFSYSGGFSLAALKGGAREVLSIDSSAKAMQLLDQNLEINGFNHTVHQSIQGDVPGWFKNYQGDPYDLIILDPPAFAKSIHKRHQAIQAYTRLNFVAMQKLSPKGLLFSFSCSQVVTEELFYGAVSAAAIQAGRDVRLLARLSQGPDHPVNFFHPEGHYLKGLLLYIE